MIWSQKDNTAFGTSKQVQAPLVPADLSQQPLISRSASSDNVHELLYHSAMDPSRVPGPWLKSSAFAALESRLPVTLPDPFLPGV